jgi:DnaD/phage-associated family protein
MTVRTISGMMPSYTVISNDFIDNYMASANGEYVKVYLYVLRAGGNASCDEIADALEMTSTDAARAVNYWSKRGLLSLHEDEAQSREAAGAAQAAGEAQAMDAARTEALAQTADAAQTAEGIPAEDAAETAAAAGVPQDDRAEHTDPGVDLDKLQGDEEFEALLYSLQQYMGRTFGQKDMESLAYMYDSLHMSVELLEYLAEICVKRGRTSSRYMEAIARDWADKGITTVEAAKAETSQYGGQVWTVMKAFGLNDRKPAPVELEYVGKWFGTYAFSEDMVKEAISRTMEAIHKPSFQYADSILEKWNAAGVHRVDEVKALDREHEKRSRTQAAGYAKPRATGFSNFEQRDTDLESNMLARLKDKL